MIKQCLVRLSVALKNGLWIILISIGLFALLELFIRIFFDQTTKFEVYDHNGRQSSARFEIYDHNGRKVTEKLTNAKGKYYKPKPRTTVYSKKPEFKVEYKYNDESMRDKNNYLGRIEIKEKTRILLLGDSFTLGAANSYENCWHVLLENELKDKIQIVKAGVSGFDQYKEFYYLKNLIEPYQPDVVMVGFLANDLFDNVALTENINLGNTRRNIPIQSNFSFDLHVQKFLQASLINFDVIYMKLYENTPRGAYFTRLTDQPVTVREKIAITKTLFKELQILSSAYGAKLVVVSIPQLYQVLKLNSQTQESQSSFSPREIDDVFSAFAIENGFHWIATLEYIADHYSNDAPTHFRVDGHLNKFGNALLAAKLVKTFNQEHDIIW